MDKILVEEDRLKKRKKQQPHLWTDPKSDKSKVITYSSENYFKIRGFISKHLDIPKQRKLVHFFNFRVFYRPIIVCIVHFYS